jgi:hypothetical protein
MTLKIYNIMSVHPLITLADGLREVEYRNHVVVDLSAKAAYARVEGQESIAGAAEVYVSAALSGARVLVGPDTQITSRAAWSQHKHWQATSTSFRLVDTGEQSLQEFFDTEAEKPEAQPPQSAVAALMYLRSVVGPKNRTPSLQKSAHQKR